MTLSARFSDRQQNVAQGVVRLSKRRTMEQERRRAEPKDRANEARMNVKHDRRNPKRGGRCTREREMRRRQAKINTTSSPNTTRSDTLTIHNA